MRVSLLSHSTADGGAAIAASRLRRALEGIGVEAHLWARVVGQDEPGVHRFGLGAGQGWNRLRSPLVSRPLRWAGLLRREVQGESLNLLPSGVSRWMRHDPCDVVNVHWMHREAASIRDLMSIPKPLVLTLHDMWWMLGTQHYREDDDPDRAPWMRHASQVGRHTGGNDWRVLDEWTLGRKCRSLRPDIVVVTPSRWLAEQARRSRSLGRLRVLSIPNALPLQVFHRFDSERRHAVRQTFGLPADKVIVSFGAFNVADDPRKGSRELAAALRCLAGTDLASKVHLAVFGGRLPAEIVELGLACTEIGPVVGAPRMAELLNASDIAVVPSRQENLPQTATEAIACGCPVVGFDVTGMPDAVAHGQTGLLAPPYEPEAMAACLASLVQGDRAAMQEAGPAYARAHWSESVVAMRHAALFEELARGGPGGQA